MWAKDRLRKYRPILDMLPVFLIQRWTQTTATVDWRLWYRCYRSLCTCLSIVGAMSFQFHNPFPLQSSLKYIWNWFSKSFLEYSGSFHLFFFQIYKRDCLNRIRWITFVKFFFSTVLLYNLHRLQVSWSTQLHIFFSLRNWIHLFSCLRPN